MSNKKCLFFVVLLIFISFYFFPNETIRMVLFQLEPFMIEDPETGEATGATVEYWKQYVAPKMGVNLEIVGILPVLRALSLLEHGEVDVIPQLTKIPAREAIFLYPETILTEIASCLVVLPDSPIKRVESSQDLFGTKIGFIEAGYIPPMLINDQITIEPVGNNDYRQISMNKLFAKRIDAHLDINYLSLLYFLHHHNYIDKIRIIMLPTEPVAVYSIFYKSEKSKKWIKDFDRVNTQGLVEKKFDYFSSLFLDAE